MRFCCFLPEDYEKRRRDRWEQITGRRITESLEEAEADTRGVIHAGLPRLLPVLPAPAPKRADQEVPDGVSVPGDERSRYLPLHTRLYAVMKDRHLKQKDLAVLFGVSTMSVSQWLKEPTDSGHRRISQARLPYVLRWLETGQEPTPDELASLEEMHHTAGGRKKREEDP